VNNVLVTEPPSEKKKNVNAWNVIVKNVTKKKRNGTHNRKMVRARQINDVCATIFPVS
jgi:hypothetical protein